MGEEFQIRRPIDVLSLVASLSRRAAPGDTFLAAFDSDRTLQILLPLDLDGSAVSDFVGMMSQLMLPGECILVVSCREPDEVGDDFSEEERDWEKAATLCKAEEVILLDWFVSCGRYAFSVAEHAATPRGWSSWNMRPPAIATNSSSLPLW